VSTIPKIHPGPTVPIDPGVLQSYNLANPAFCHQSNVHRPDILMTNPAYFNNSRYEDISCQAIKPIYDGPEADLMPFLLQLDIHQQDEGWALATYITVVDKTYDLTVDFAHVAENDVTENAKTCWTSKTVATDKHTVGHDTSHACLLAKCLMASISSDLILNILNCIPQHYCNDGTTCYGP
jgi:hypothetical protein